MRDFSGETWKLAIVFRAQFRKNAGVRDIRVIDMLVVQVRSLFCPILLPLTGVVLKGQQDLKEVVEHWKQTTHIMAKWFPEDNREEKPKDFISKFLSGQE